MWIYRRMLKISYQQHISNDDILVGLNVRPQLMKMIKERKCRYFGHIVRGERCEYQRLLLEGTVGGKKGREDHGTLASATSETGWELTMLLRFEKAQDHDQWRSMVAKVPDGYGTRDWLIEMVHNDPYILLHFRVHYVLQTGAKSGVRSFICNSTLLHSGETITIACSITPLPPRIYFTSENSIWRSAKPKPL